MPWINAWQRAEAISAADRIIGDSKGPGDSAEHVAEYLRVMNILEECFGVGCDAIRVYEEWARSGEP
jgi:hypothetical protein